MPRIGSRGQVIGRPPRAQKPIYRSYYLPKVLADEFSATMDQRTSKCVAAGMIFILGATKTVQDELVEIADKLPPAEAVREVRRRLPAWLQEIRAAQEAAGMPTRKPVKVYKAPQNKAPRSRATPPRRR